MAIRDTINPEVVRRAIETAVHNAVNEIHNTLDNVLGPQEPEGHYPKEGTICFEIWNCLDSIRGTGKIPKLEDILKTANVRRWNETTSRTQYAAWRKYHNIPSQRYN